MCRCVGTVPDILGLVLPSFRPNSGSESKMPGRVLKNCRCHCSSAERGMGGWWWEGLPPVRTRKSRANSLCLDIEHPRRNCSMCRTHRNKEQCLETSLCSSSFGPQEGPIRGWEATPQRPKTPQEIARRGPGDQTSRRGRVFHLLQRYRRKCSRC